MQRMFHDTDSNNDALHKLTFLAAQNQENHPFQ